MHYSGGDLIRRDVDTCLALNDAIQVYEQKAYGEAISAFEKMQEQPEATGQCGVNPKDIQLLLESQAQQAIIVGEEFTKMPQPKERRLFAHNWLSLLHHTVPTNRAWLHCWCIASNSNPQWVCHVC